MGIIKTLDKETISKIAAGEVIDRPSSVVKELLENAVDANSKSIKIFIKDAGLKEITVIDDGDGMSKEDLSECFKRHATSKISSINDLETHLLFGFRGEALYSIASVSQLLISSRRSDTLEGNFIDLEGGDVINSGMIGMPIGTKVQVKNLFYNVPARKKYLKDAGEELRFITNTITRFSMIHPDISFRFYHNETELLNLQQDEDHWARIKNLFSEEYANSLIPISISDPAVSAKGYISRPEEFRAGKLKQFIYVNNRHIRDNMISDAVKSAYGNLADNKKYPQFILFIETPANTIDVNIHPQKEKIRFLNKDLIYSLIRENVLAALQSQDLTPQNSPYKFVRDALSESEYDFVLPQNLKLKENEHENYIQLHSLYIVLEVPEGMLMLDQHAAHERIIFEKMSTALVEKLDDYYSIDLSQPHVLILDKEDSYVVYQATDVLEKIGFRISENKIMSVPYFLQGRNLDLILKEFIDNYDDGNLKPDLDSNTLTALSHLACKAAIKDGQKLSQAEMQYIVEELKVCKTPYTCPHGRPAQVLIPKNEIEKWFKRT